MARRKPEERNSAVERQRQSIRRKYRSKKKITKSRKIIAGERGHLVNMIVILKIAGYSNTQIGQVVNLGRGQVKSILAAPEVADLMNDTLEALPLAARNLMESYSVEAVQTIADLMRTETEWKPRLAAAVEILDRTGLPKASRSEQKIHKTEEQLTTFADDGIVESLRHASPEVQEEAAQLIERLENMLEEHSAVGEEEEVDEAEGS